MTKSSKIFKLSTFQLVINCKQQHFMKIIKKLIYYSNNPTMNSLARMILSNDKDIVTSSTQSSNLKPRITVSGLYAANKRCFVCNETVRNAFAENFIATIETSHTKTKFPNKLSQLVGSGFLVTVCVDDIICSRCINLVNDLDRLENDAKRVRTNLLNLLYRRHRILNDTATTTTTTTTATYANPPPIKMQKLNTGISTPSSLLGISCDGKRKQQTQINLSQSKPTTPVQQIKIGVGSANSTLQHRSAGIQTLRRRITKIYKCLTCDYKTWCINYRFFNSHYETCRNQNFQCKNCRKIFPNFGAFKQHMVYEHNIPMDHTCSICHVNYLTEMILRKHMETTHTTSVLVTSTVTLPVGQIISPEAAMANTVPQLHQIQNLHNQPTLNSNSGIDRSKNTTLSPGGTATTTSLSFIRH